MFWEVTCSTFASHCLPKSFWPYIPGTNSGTSKSHEVETISAYMVCAVSCISFIALNLLYCYRVCTSLFTMEFTSLEVLFTVWNYEIMCICCQHMLDMPIRTIICDNLVSELLNLFLHSKCQIYPVRLCIYEDELQLLLHALMIYIRCQQQIITTNENSFRGGNSSLLPQTLQLVTVITKQKLSEFFHFLLNCCWMYFLLSNKYP